MEVQTPSRDQIMFQKLQFTVQTSQTEKKSDITTAN